MIEYCKDSGLVKITSVEVVNIEEVADEVFSAIIGAIDRWMDYTEVYIDDADIDDFMNLVVEKAKSKIKGE